MLQKYASVDSETMAAALPRADLTVKPMHISIRIRIRTKTNRDRVRSLVTIRRNAYRWDDAGQGEFIGDTPHTIQLYYL